jgi:histidinol-phosphatase
MNDGSLLLEAVSEVARVAGAVANRYFGFRLAGLDVETKPDGSPVTIADRAAESAARDWIARRFANDDVLGEELGSVDRGVSRRWIIDPIDGTKSYVRGVPLWGTLIAVVEGERVLASAAYFPALEELLCAGADLGCWWNGARSSVSTIDRLAEATVLTTDERFAAAPAREAVWRGFASRAGLSRSWGDCYGYLLVATGRAEVMVDGAGAPWDTAAVSLAITQAGGVFTDWSGRATAFGGSGIATNGALAVQVRALLDDGATPHDGARS